MADIWWHQWLNAADNNICMIGGIHSGFTNIAGFWVDDHWADISDETLRKGDLFCDMQRLVAWSEASDPAPELLERQSCKNQNSLSG